MIQLRRFVIAMVALGVAGLATSVYAQGNQKSVQNEASALRKLDRKALGRRI